MAECVCCKGQTLSPASAFCLDCVTSLFGSVAEATKEFRGTWSAFAKSWTTGNASGQYAHSREYGSRDVCPDHVVEYKHQLNQFLRAVVKESGHVPMNVALREARTFVAPPYSYAGFIVVFSQERPVRPTDPVLAWFDDHGFPDLRDIESLSTTVRFPVAFTVRLGSAAEHPRKVAEELVKRADDYFLSLRYVFPDIPDERRISGKWKTEPGPSWPEPSTEPLEGEWDHAESEGQEYEACLI